MVWCCRLLAVELEEAHSLVGQLNELEKEPVEVIREYLDEIAEVRRKELEKQELEEGFKRKQLAMAPVSAAQMGAELLKMTSEDEARILSEAEGSRFTIDDVSLNCFTTQSKVRKFCVALVEFRGRCAVPGFGVIHINVKTIMLLVVIFNSLVIAAEGPPGYVHASKKFAVLLVVGDQMCLLAYMGEAAMKIIAYGFVLTPNAYLLDPWNRLDFFVVLVSVLDLFVMLLGLESGWTSSFKLLRILRPIKLLNVRPPQRLRLVP